MQERMVLQVWSGVARCGQSGTRLESLGDGQEASQSTFGLFEARARRWPSSRKTGAERSRKASYRAFFHGTRIAGGITG
jgi:hypothetical protein